MVDAVRSHAPGFIFTTALPPGIAAAATASIAHLKKSGIERAGQRAAVAATKAALRKAGLPVLTTETHIVPVMVGDPDLCKQASDLLLERHGIYIQPINYPTVARGTERLRITPTPAHDFRLIQQLADAMVAVWQELDPAARKRLSSRRTACEDDRGWRLGQLVRRLTYYPAPGLKANCQVVSPSTVSTVDKAAWAISSSRSIFSVVAAGARRRAAERRVSGAAQRRRTVRIAVRVAVVRMQLDHAGGTVIGPHGRFMMNCVCKDGRP